MPPPYSGSPDFKHHPWVPSILDSPEQEIISRKAAQTGLSMACIMFALYAMDQKKLSVLYGLPNQIPDAKDFSSARFDPLIASSPYISKMFTNISNINLKMCGHCALYIRGSNGKASFDSVPAGVVILDEVDKMSERAVQKATERQSAQLEKFFRAISTPSIPKYGIDALYEDTTQDIFVFRCPSCSKYIDLKFPDSVVITAESHRDPKVKESYYICTECKAKLPNEDKPEYLATGKWVATYPGRNARGVTVSQLYISTLTAGDISKSYLESTTSQVKEQEFFNSKLGLPHIVEGAQIDEDDINACMNFYRNGDLSQAKGFLTFGVDVGKYLHITIVKWRFEPGEYYNIHEKTIGQVIWHGKVLKKTATFDELDRLLKKWPQFMAGVIDAAPERASSESFAKRHRGLVYTCDYNEHAKGKEIQVSDNHIAVNRTFQLDVALARINDQKPRITFPVDTDQEFKDHIQNLVRKPEVASNGDTVYRYYKTGRTDYAHTLVYNELALELGAGAGGHSEIITKA